MKTYTVRFEKEKETKNTVKFTEVPAEGYQPPVIVTLYIQKWAVGSATEVEVEVRLIK